MLILTRRLNESILIGDAIEVKVLQVGSTVQLGIVAPRAIPVWRKEVVQAVERENLRAARPSSPALARLLQDPRLRGEGERSGDAPA